MLNLKHDALMMLCGILDKRNQHERSRLRAQWKIAYWNKVKRAVVNKTKAVAYRVKDVDDIIYKNRKLYLKAAKLCGLHRKNTAKSVANLLKISCSSMIFEEGIIISLSVAPDLGFTHIHEKAFGDLYQRWEMDKEMDKVLAA